MAWSSAALLGLAARFGLAGWGGEEESGAMGSVAISSLEDAIREVG